MAVSAGNGVNVVYDPVGGDAFLEEPDTTHIDNRTHARFYVHERRCVLVIMMQEWWFLASHPNLWPRKALQ